MFHEFELSTGEHVVLNIDYIHAAMAQQRLTLILSDNSNYVVNMPYAEVRSLLVDGSSEGSGQRAAA